MSSNRGASQRAVASSAESSSEVQRLKPRAVGLTGVVFMVIASAAPIMAMTGNLPVAVGFGNAAGAPAGYLVTMVILIIFAVGYVAMSRYITATGAFYGYISHGLGRVVGMASGLLAAMAYVVFEAAIVGIFSAFAQTTFSEQLGVTLPWQLFAVLILVSVAVLAYFGIDVVAKVLAVLLILEISVLLLMAFAVLLSGGGPVGIPLSSINPVNAFTGPAPGLGLLFAFLSWIGFEATAIYGEESREPKRIVPLATYIAVIAIGVFYVFVSWMVVAGNGLEQSVATAKGENAFALFFNPTREFVGGWAVVLFQWLLLTGSFASGLAFHNHASRYLYAIGREGLINSNLGRSHPVHGSPYVASFVQSGITAVIVGAFWVAGQDPYISLYVLTALLGALALLVVQTLCSFAVIGYFSRTRPEARHWFRTILAPLVSGVAMSVVVVLLVTNLSTAAGDASDTLFFRLIPWIVIGVFLTGVALALYMRSRSPDKYEKLGHIVYDEAEERSEVDATTRGDTQRRASRGS